MRLRRREAPQLGLLAALALAATLLTVGAGAGSAGHEQETLAASSWRGLVGSPREQVAVGQRVIVVLNSPSLADRVAAAGGQATEAQQRRWTAAALAADNLLIARLAQDGVRVRPEHRYARVLTGFSAPLDPRAVAFLERAPEVAGVYPVRVTYPASVSSTLIEKGGLAPGVASRPERQPARVRRARRDDRAARHGRRREASVRPRPGLRRLRRWSATPATRARGPSPEDPTRLERHGTQMAGLLVGSAGPGQDRTASRRERRCSRSGSRAGSARRAGAGRSTGAPTS